MLHSSQVDNHEHPKKQQQSSTLTRYAHETQQ